MASSLSPSESRIGTWKLVTIALNSAAIYVLAYILVFGVLQLSQAAMAYRYVIPTILHPSKLNYLIQDPEWRRSIIVIVFSTGPVLCLLLAVVALFRLRSTLEDRGSAKVFYAWVVLHGCNQFFGAMVADNFLRDGFWLAPAYLVITSTVPAIALGFLFANLCLVIGYKLSLPFLKTCDSISLMRLENRPKLIWITIFAPWAIGTLAVNLSKIGTMTMLEAAHSLVILLLLIPMAVGIRFEMHELTVPAPRRPRLERVLIVSALTALIGWRAITHKGIYFKPHGYRSYPGRDVVDKVR